MLMQICSLLLHVEPMNGPSGQAKHILVDNDH